MAKTNYTQIDFFYGSNIRIPNLDIAFFEIDHGAVTFNSNMDQIFNNAGPNGYIYTVRIANIPRARWFIRDKPAVEYIDKLILLLANAPKKVPDPVKRARELIKNYGMLGMTARQIYFQYYMEDPYYFPENMAQYMEVDGYIYKVKDTNVIANTKNNVSYDHHLLARMYNLASVKIIKETPVSQIQGLQPGE